MSSASSPPSTYAELALRLPFHLCVWDNDAERLSRLLLLLPQQPPAAAAAAAAAAPGSPSLVASPRVPPAPPPLSGGGGGGAGAGPLPAFVLDVNALDAQGNSPLLLAYRLGRTQLARMLLAARCEPRIRSREGWEPMQVASLTANADLVRTAVVAYLAETDAAFSRRLPKLQARLAELPDFSLRMSWDFKTWVPLLGALLPSDTYAIYKRGGELRLDSTLLGMSGLRWERGSVSLLLKEGARVYVLDNELKTAADARTAFTHPQDVQVQDWVRKLLCSTQKITDYWSRDARVTPVVRQGVLGSIAGFFGGGGAAAKEPRGRVTDTGAFSAATQSLSGVPLERGPEAGGGGGGGGGAAAAAGTADACGPSEAAARARRGAAMERRRCSIATIAIKNRGFEWTPQIRHRRADLTPWGCLRVEEVDLVCRFEGFHLTVQAVTK